MTEGHEDYLGDLWDLLPTDPTDFIEDTPTEDESEKSPSSKWAFDHDADISAHHIKFTAANARAAIADIFGADGKADSDIDLDGNDLIGGDVILPANGVIKVADGTPQILFDNANDWLEITGKVGFGVPAPQEAADILGHISLGSSRTDDLEKSGYILLPTKDMAEEYVYIFGAVAGSDTDVLRFGGSSGSYNAVMEIGFYTAAARYTLTGTERLNIDKDGNIDIIAHDAGTVGLNLGGTLVTASAAELNILDVAANNININSHNLINVGAITTLNDTLWNKAAALYGTMERSDVVTLQFFVYNHDNMGLFFDAGYAAPNMSAGWRSGDPTSNFGIYKHGNILDFVYDGPVAVDGAVTWNSGIEMDTSGQITIADLAGVGVRAVVVDAAGQLSAP